MAELPLALQILQGLGAGVGLVTGLFYFGERLVKHYPIAFIALDEGNKQGRSRETILRIENKGARPILVSWETGRQANKFSVSKGKKYSELIPAQIDGRSWLMVGGNEKVDLVLFDPPNYPEIPTDGEVWTQLTWRLAQPICYKFDRKIPVRIKKGDLEIMRNGEPGALA